MPDAKVGLFSRFRVKKTTTKNTKIKLSIILMIFSGSMFETNSVAFDPNTQLMKLLLFPLITVYNSFHRRPKETTQGRV